MSSTQTLTDMMDPARAAALYATLAITRPASAPLIPFAHQIYFWQASPPAGLGNDGHAALGGLIPDTGLPRRMWAGGTLRFDAPLMTGIPAQKTTRLETVTRKQGRAGPLAIVTLCHQISQSGRVAVTEWQDILYRQEHGTGAPDPVAPLAPYSPEVEELHSFSPTLLFRYSGLTFNGHRIHYDVDYCRKVEGYPGLVVHGPLLAQLLMLLAEQRLGKLSSFRFRATSPLYHTDTALICARGNRLWVAGPDGRMCMDAEAA